MQTLAQTQKMDQLEQEIHELHEEVTTLRVKVERLTNLVSLLIVQQKPQPLGVRPPQRQHQPLRIQLARQKAPQQLDTQNHALGMPFDPIPMRYIDLLPKLLEKKLVQTRAPPLVSGRLPAGYRPDLTCAFHQGAPGHDIEHCFALKKIVQKLIEVGLLPFEDLNPGMQSRHTALQQYIPHNQAHKALQFDQILMKYTDLLPTLLMEDLVQTRPPPPIPKKLPTHWKPDLTCAFHQGAQGHDVENHHY